MSDARIAVIAHFLGDTPYMARYLASLERAESNPVTDMMRDIARRNRKGTPPRVRYTESCRVALKTCAACGPCVDCGVRLVVLAHVGAHRKRCSSCAAKKLEAA